jgi:lipopolysaccharide/colanic/teichoic acid biosynthesis glycosyltransferase
MDIICATLGLLLLAPFLLVTALAIKLDSPGPVLFRQCRIGRHSRRFQMFKFRTMVADAPARRAELLDRNQTGGLFKVADDPRVTRVGRMLRRASLDEIPQLLNVLAGDMSLVGPRPLVPEEDQKVEGWQRRRLQVPPGMTGHWQILGKTRVPLHEMAKIDYLYGANWSLWGDVKTLFRTVPHVLGRKGM